MVCGELPSSFFLVVYSPAIITIAPSPLSVPPGKQPVCAHHEPEMRGEHRVGGGGGGGE